MYNKIKYFCTGYVNSKGFGNFLEDNLSLPRKNIKLFTSELKRKLDAKYLSLVNSGSSANMVASLILKELLKTKGMKKFMKKDYNDKNKKCL